MGDDKELYTLIDNMSINKGSYFGTTELDRYICLYIITSNKLNDEYYNGVLSVK